MGGDKDPSKDGAFLERFSRALAELDSGWANTSYVLALSGGGDSMALAGMLQECVGHDRVFCAILDHGLRPGSREEAELVRDRASRLGFQAGIESADLASLVLSRGKGMEEAGRYARYQYLERTRKERRAKYVLTAHQADDNAETILMRIAKGAGPGALRGIPARTGSVLRPLLGFRKRELEGYLRSRGMDWVEDPSNRDESMLRNRVRRRIVPAFELINPRFLEGAARGSELASAEEDFWEERLERLEREMVKPFSPGPGEDGGRLAGKKGGWGRGGEASGREAEGGRRAAGAGSGAASRWSLPGAGGGAVPAGEPDGSAVSVGSGGPGGSDLPAGPPVSPPGGRGGAGPISESQDASPGGGGSGKRLGPALSPLYKGSGGYLIELEAFSGLHLAEKRRLLGRLAMRIRPGGAGSAEPVSFETVERALRYVGGGGRKGIDLPGGRRVVISGRFLYMGPASRWTT
jgi:tRNA(Ile)-lysidine synthetase-like protein